MSLAEKILSRAQSIRAMMSAVLELPPEVTPKRFKRTEPTPYQGRAKFRARVKPGDGLDCFEEKDCRGDMVVQLPPRVWKVAPEIAGHVIASQIGNASQRRESSVFKRVTWG